MASQTPKDISLAEVAVLLKLSPFEAFQLVTAGKLEGRKHGKRWVVTRTSLEAYQRRQAKGA